MHEFRLVPLLHSSRADGADSTDSGHGLASDDGDRSNIR
jgi:hypothetical protein